jgi:membrane-associated phospholipid phosphatase
VADIEGLFSIPSAVGRREHAMACAGPQQRWQVVLGEMLAQVGAAECVQEASGSISVKMKIAGTTWESSPSAEGDLTAQLARVELMADLRPERITEILDQVGFAPAYWANILPISPLRTPFTLELMAAVASFAAFVVQRCKVAANRPRPHEYSPRIQPIIETPPHGAFPGGHSTECTLVSAVLYRLLDQVLSASEITDPPSAEPTTALGHVHRMLFALSDRIGENREVAGLHFSADTAAGRELAVALFAHVIDPVLKRAHTSSSTVPVATGLDNLLWLCGKAANEWKTP